MAERLGPHSGYSLVLREFQDQTDYPTAEQLLDRLDPYLNRFCCLCGGAKPLERVTCEDCSHVCPDQDCCGKPRWVKLPGQDMCAHCEAWLFKLDNEVDGEGNVVANLERDGYYVYLLERDSDSSEEYVGMTYDPSRRQYDHGDGIWVRNYIRERDDIGDPDAYYERAWESHCRQLWLDSPSGISPYQVVIAPVGD